MTYKSAGNSGSEGRGEFVLRRINTFLRRLYSFLDRGHSLEHARKIIGLDQQ
jgi:hypothetical protein